MKTLPRWAIIAIVVGIFALCLVVVGQFAKKSTVYVEGDVTLAPELQEAAKGIRTMFVILFDEDSPMPMPFGAVRFTLGDDPVGRFREFAITRENLNRMNTGNETLPRSLRIKARLDRDGVAGPDQSGDLVGELRGVAIGAKISLHIQNAVP